MGEEELPRTRRLCRTLISCGVISEGRRDKRRRVPVEWEEGGGRKAQLENRCRAFQLSVGIASGVEDHAHARKFLLALH